MSDHLPGRMLQRIAARLAPAATYERVLLPLIADLQFEHARARGPGQRMVARARGLVAFWLLFTAAGCFTVFVGTRDERAAAGRSMLRALAATALLTSVVAFHFCWQMLESPSLLRLYPLTLPSTLAVALPLGALIGGALGRSVGSPEHRRVSWRVALAAAAVTFGLVAWWTPLANQALLRGIVRAAAEEPALRVEVSTPPPFRFDHGHRGMTLGQLTERAAHIRAWGRILEELPYLEAEWHKRPAQGVAGLVLSLLGVGLGRLRWRRLFRGLAALGVGIGFYAAVNTTARLVDAGRDPALAAWTPVVALAVFTFVVRRAVPLRATS